MQSAKLQKDKLVLIEKIIQSKNSDLIDYLNEIFVDKITYQLPDEKLFEVNEASEKYHSGEEKSFSWDEVKSNARMKSNGKKS